MKLYKRIFAQSWAQAIVAFLAAGYLWFVKITGKWQWRGWDEHVQPLLNTDQPFIFVFWHGRLMPTTLSWRPKKPLYMLNSTHRDGRLIAATYAYFDIQSIWGSSTRGGSQAIREMIRALKSGKVVAITPDGPRGPRQRAQRGMVDVARLSGAYIVPLISAYAPCKTLSTWDSLRITLPFGRGIFKYLAPIAVPRNADEAQLESLREQIETLLNNETRALDIELNIMPTEPAPALGASTAKEGGPA